MRYVLTGPSKIEQESHAVIAEALKGLWNVEEVTSGAAHGVDTVGAIFAMSLFPNAHHRIVIPSAPCNYAWASGLYGRPNVELIEMDFVDGELNGSSYRRRNERMFEPDDPEKTMLVAFLRNPSSGFYRSGEWMTVNIAKRRGARVLAFDVERVGQPVMLP
jgi:hypothetical protein